MDSTQSTKGFFGLGIAPQLLDTLTRLKFISPTPIQEKAIPIAIEGKDLMGIAQTGTGKTLAFGVPLIQRLSQDAGLSAGRQGIALIMLPTRELAVQVQETLEKLGRSLGFRSVLLIGGVSIQPQIRGLRSQPRIIIGTPGRIYDHLQQKTLNLSQAKILVLDEADRMLDMGFAPQIKRIIETMPRERQTMLFSATMPREIVALATSYMKLPIRIEVAPAGSTAADVAQELYVVQRGDKLRLLEKLLQEYRGSVLVFSRTKHGAHKICNTVRAMGHRSAEIHSNRSFGQRQDALDGFKSGKYRVLVATDIAARGIHVSGIEVVINFDVPEHAEDYVHRIGRTARAGASGRAITFASPDQSNEVRDIQKLTRSWIPIAKLPMLPPHRAVAPSPIQTGFQHSARPFSRPPYRRNVR